MPYRSITCAERRTAPYVYESTRPMITHASRVLYGSTAHTHTYHSARMALGLAILTRNRIAPRKLNQTPAPHVTSHARRCSCTLGLYPFTRTHVYSLGLRVYNSNVYINAHYYLDTYIPFHVVCSMYTNNYVYIVGYIIVYKCRSE